MTEDDKLTTSIKVLTSILDEREKTIRELSTALDELFRRLVEVEGGTKRPDGSPEVGIV